MYKKTQSIFILVFLFFMCIACNKKKINVEHTEMQLNTSNTLNVINYINDSIGFAAGGSRYSLSEIFKTTDAGKTWTSYNFGNDGKSIFDLKQLSNGTLVAVGVSGYQVFSTDTGNTWQFNQISNWENAQKICAINDKILIAQGLSNSGNILLQDANKQTVLVNNFVNEICDIKMVNNQMGYAAGLGVVYKTVDAGNTWTLTNATGDLFRGLVCLDSNTIITVGYNGSIRKSTDAGSTWTNIKNANGLSGNDRFNAIVKINNHLCYAVGDNGLLAEIDGLQNAYVIAKKFTSKNLISVCLKNNTTLAIVGENGLYVEVKF